MDILAARKKAAGWARMQDKVEAESMAPAAVEKARSENTREPEGAANEIHAQEIEMLSFRLGSEEYVLPVDEIQEVLKSRELTLVPNSPPHVLGVTSIRGTVLPVLDLGRRLGLPPAVRDEKARIIIISPDDEAAGILVDRVTGVVRISPDAVHPAPETIEQGAEFLKGIARKDNRLYILLDLHKAAGA